MTIKARFINSQSRPAPRPRISPCVADRRREPAHSPNVHIRPDGLIDPLVGPSARHILRLSPPSYAAVRICSLQREKMLPGSESSADRTLGHAAASLYRINPYRF